MRQVLRVAAHVGIFSLVILLAEPYVASSPLRYGERVVTVIASEKVNLRALPELRPDTIIAQVYSGTQLRLLQRVEDWFKVYLPTGEIAWLSAQLGREDVARDLVQVNVPVARIRADFGLDSPVVGKAEKGTFLHPLEVKDKWVKVRLPDEGSGWIWGDLVEVHRVSRDENSLEESSTQTLLLLASVGSGVSAFSFLLVMTTVFRRKRRQARRNLYE